MLFQSGTEQVQFPQKLKVLDAGTDNTYLHLDVKSEGMDDVYLSLHKIDHEPHM